MLSVLVKGNDGVTLLQGGQQHRAPGWGCAGHSPHQVGFLVSE